MEAVENGGHILAVGRESHQPVAGALCSSGDRGGRLEGLGLMRWRGGPTPPPKLPPERIEGLLDKISTHTPSLPLSHTHTEGSQHLVLWSETPPPRIKSSLAAGGPATRRHLPYNQTAKAILAIEKPVGATILVQVDGMQAKEDS